MNKRVLGLVGSSKAHTNDANVGDSRAASVCYFRLPLFTRVHLILYLSLFSISFCVSQNKPKEEIAKLKSSTLAALTLNFSSFTIRAVLKFKCIIVKYVCRKTNVVITNHKSLIYKRIHMALRSHLIYKAAICPTWMQILTTGKQSHMNQFTLDTIISFLSFASRLISLIHSPFTCKRAFRVFFLRQKIIEIAG